MRSKSILLLCSAIAVSLSCSEASSPTIPEVDDNPTFLVQDALHNGGNAHFYWLPPVVTGAPSTIGEFDSTLSPTVEICEVGETGCVLTLATFTSSSGTGGEFVEVNPQAEYYRVFWHTADFNLEPDKTYRVSVEVYGIRLGVGSFTCCCQVTHSVSPVSYLA